MLFNILAILAIDVIIIFVIFVVRIIIRNIKYRRWRKFASPAVGTVGELLNVTSNYDKNGEISSSQYNYTLQITHNGQIFHNIYSEKCKPNCTPITQPGKKINILWSASKQEYLQIARTRKEIIQVIKQECISSVTLAFRFLGKARRW